MSRGQERVPQERMLGGLQTLVVPGEPGGLVVAMLHGFGADAYDLLPLADAVAAPPGTTWLFPHAPHEVEIGPHMTGKAWFPIDLMALQLAMMSGRTRDLAQDAPPALAVSRQMVGQMVADFGAELSRTVLAGFSQGAMTATSLAMHADQAPAGLAILSGTLIDAPQWRQLAPLRKGLRYMQSHGRQDPMLGFAAAESLHQLLQSAGWQGEFVAFGGGHEIPGSALRALAELLKACQPAN